jgi:hypothetical protein
MNCFSHAYRFIDGDPYFVVGTSIPDWLGMIDRKTRVRRQSALPLIDCEDSATQALARGIIQHHDDDLWFHQSPAFAELQVTFTRQLGALFDESRFRPHFVAHIALEMLIDAVLAEFDLGRLDRYYTLVQSVDPAFVESIVNRVAAKKTDRLAAYFPRYLREAFLYDYLRDEGVSYRVNRILSAIGLGALPPVFTEWVGSVRGAVRHRIAELLDPPVGQLKFEFSSWRQAMDDCPL